MIKISFDNSFKRAFKKCIKGNKTLEKKFRDKLEQFQKNPFEPSLKTHKLSGKLKDLWSFTIEHDIRIIFYFTDNNDAVFIGIGSHDQVY